MEEKYIKLTEDLKAAAAEAARARIVDDTGLANADYVILIMRGASIEKVSQAVKNAGLTSCPIAPNEFSIGGYFSGKADRRTEMVEAFAEALVKKGYHCRVHYELQ